MLSSEADRVTRSLLLIYHALKLDESKLDDSLLCRRSDSDIRNLRLDVVVVLRSKCSKTDLQPCDRIRRL